MSNSNATGEPPVTGIFYCVIPHHPPNPTPWMPYDEPTPLGRSGFNCPFCGAWVFWGAFHVCAPSAPPVPPRPEPPPPPKEKKQPFVCPKCKGETRIGDFTCKPCGGTGIVWG